MKEPISVPKKAPKIKKEEVILVSKTPPAVINEAARELQRIYDYAQAKIAKEAKLGQTDDDYEFLKTDSPRV